MTTYAVFEKSTGVITRVIQGPKSVAVLQHTEGCGLVLCDESVLDTTHWVDQSGHARKVREKRPLDTTNTVDGLVVTLPAIPAGTHVDVDGHILIVDEAPTEVEFDVPGTYLIQLYPPPQYQDTELEVTVG